MNQLTIALISFSVLIPLVTGLFRIKRVDRAHYPFLIYLTLGFCNEFLSFYLIRKGHSNAINSNVYFLLAGFLITYQFKRWQLFKSVTNLYFFILLLLLFTWLIDTFIWGSIKIFASHYIVIYSFIIVLMSINMINQVMVTAKQSILKNLVFIVCAGFILFFTNAVIMESAYIYSLKFSSQIQAIIFRVMSLILLFTNLLYTVAFLWMPRKRRFSFS